jgi:tetratricopeptide (TPR) repeat protein
MAELAQTLDYMPLAITQAGALINKQFPRLSISSFIAEFNKSDAERTQLLDSSAVEPGRDRERTNSIVATWHITFQYVRRTNPSAARLLSLMCLFNRQGIPETLLVGQYGEDATSLAKLAPRIPWRKKWRRVLRKGQIKGGNEWACNFDDDWQTLTDFSLIKTNADGHHFDMHRLVQITTKKWLDLQNELQRWKAKFIVLMDENCLDVQNDLQRRKDKSFGLMGQNYPDFKSLMPHAMAAVPYRPLGGEVLRPWGCLMHKLASHKAEQADFDVARNLHQAAFEAFQITLGVDDPQSISCVREVAYILSLQKDYALSETLHRKVLAARERVLGQEHPDTLRSMDDLGDVLRNVQKYDESDATKLRALKIKESVFGVESKTTQDTMGDISFNLMLDGKHSEAEVMLLKKNAARNKDALLKFDEIWCHDMCGLGRITQFRGNLKEAEAIFRKVYLVQKKAMTTEEGPDRQLTETSYLLAEVLTIQEHYAEAEGLYRQVLDGYVKARREEKETLSIMGQLAVVLKKVGKVKEAEELCQKARKGWEHIGREDDDHVVIVSVYTLAGLFYEDELLDEALALYERAYTSVKTTLGDGDEAFLSPFLEDYTRCGEMIAMRDTKVPKSAMDDWLDIDIEPEYKDAREQAVFFGPAAIAV